MHVAFFLVFSLDVSRDGLYSIPHPPFHCPNLQPQVFSFYFYFLKMVPYLLYTVFSMYTLCKSRAFLLQII